MALRRWKPFVSAFPHIDAAIEAAYADVLHSRDEIRSARARIIEMLCDASDDDGGGEKAEGFCALLDAAMAESLVTLRAVPAEKIALVSGDLVGAVGALMKDHDSARVRGLARDVVRGWRAGAKATLDTARAAMDVLDGLSSTPPAPPPQDNTALAAGSDTEANKIPEQRPRKTAVVSSCPLPKKRVPVVSTSSAKPSSTNTGAPAIVPAQSKKTPPVVVSSAAEEKKMEATKRKLHERYQEAEEAKRRRTIQVIKPTMGTTRQRQRNEQHPDVRPNCARAAERCFMKKSSSLRTRV